MPRHHSLLTAALLVSLALPLDTTLLGDEPPAPTPTAEPTSEPTSEPGAGTGPTPPEEPSSSPTADATAEASGDPTADPTADPTGDPTAEPTTDPTAEPEVVVPLLPPAPTTRRLSNGCRVGARGLPGCGAYLGASHGGNDDPRALERRAGTQLGVRRTYFRGDQVDYALDIVREDLAHGRLPWISFKLPLSWEAMASGAGDGWTRDLARRLAAVPGPVWLAFHHEPEGDGDMQAWRRMQERLGPIVRRTAPNVAFTVILTGWNQVYGERAYRLPSLWPRTKVDVAGFDIYNEFGVRKHGSMIDEWPRLRRSYFGPLSEWARQRGVAWGLAETGITDRGFRASPRWIQRSFRAMKEHGGVAFAYFDSPLNTTASYALRSPAKVASFTRTLPRGARLPRP